MNDWYKGLPKKRMGAGALIFDEEGKLLVVKPKYKDYWSVPGGVIEENESPRAACIREVKEETDIDILAAEFVSVDYIDDADGKGENLQFTFCGGVLRNDQKISLDEKELSGYRFISVDEAKSLFSKNLATRLPKCLETIKNHKGIYLENGL